MDFHCTQDPGDENDYLACAVARVGTAERSPRSSKSPVDFGSDRVLLDRDLGDEDDSAAPAG